MMKKHRKRIKYNADPLSLVLRVWLLVICLAGCLGQSNEPGPTASVEEPPEPVLPAPEPQPIVNETAPIFPIHYNGTGCDAMIFVHAVDFAAANERLPLGFVAADLGELLELGFRIDKAAIGLVIYACEYDDVVGGRLASASVNIFVDAPVLNGESTDPDGIFVNAYELHRFTLDNHTGARHLEAGWDMTFGLEVVTLRYDVAEPATPPEEVQCPSNDPDVQRMCSRIPNPIVGMTEGTLDGERAFIGGVGGATTYHLENRTNRFWHQTAEGVSYDEYTLNKNGRGAASGCIYDSPAIRDMIGEASCQADVDPEKGTITNLGIAIQDFEIKGAIHHLPGVFA